jgi:hypothetical protein
VERDSGGYKTDLGMAASEISEIQKYRFGGPGSINRLAEEGIACFSPLFIIPADTPSK